MKYKVIKDFDSLKKGDMLVRSTEEPSIFYFEEETDNSYKFVSYNDTIIQDLLENGYVVDIEDEDDCSDSENKIDKVIAEIDSLLEKYKQNNEEITEKVANSELPLCAKVEADTVHGNLTKVLNHIKNMLKSDE